MAEREDKVISALETEILKIKNKENKFYFYVYDTKGTPSENLYYIYDLALRLSERGYDVNMLHSDKDFVGVGAWMGEEYSSLPHYNISKDEVPLSVSDFLFIPEINANVMSAIKNKKEVLCKKIAILTNEHYLSDIMRPIGATWDNLEIFDCIAASEDLATRIKEIFPNVRVQVVKPRIHKVFKNVSNEPKSLIINIITKTTEHATSIVNKLQWLYRQYGFAAIRELKGLSITEKAKALKEAFLTIWLDTDTEIGLEALEAMSAGSIVVGKVPEHSLDWMYDEKGQLKDNAIWFEKNQDIPEIIVSAIQTYFYDQLPKEVYENMDKTLKEFSNAEESDIVNVIEKHFIEGRVKEFEMLESGIKNNDEKEAEK